MTYTIIGIVAVLIFVFGNGTGDRMVRINLTHSRYRFFELPVHLGGVLVIIASSCISIVLFFSLLIGPFAGVQS